jgi:ComF family protein
MTNPQPQSHLPTQSTLTLPGRTLWNNLIDALFPPHCGGCRADGSLWCEDCRSKMALIQEPLCAKCGEPNTPSRLCSNCRQHPLKIEFIRSVAIFQGTLRDAIHRFKYERLASLYGPFGDLLAEHWLAHQFQADWLVPVPLHSARQRDRGYNQSALLARHMSDRIHTPTIENALKRVRATAIQMELNAIERRENVAGAFECVDARIQTKRICVIDDVCTTGATLDACAAALYRAGAASVFALTLARTP